MGSDDGRAEKADETLDSVANTMHGLDAHASHAWIVSCCLLPSNSTMLLPVVQLRSGVILLMGDLVVS
jgi:hypothetical protein